MNSMGATCSDPVPDTVVIRFWSGAGIVSDSFSVAAHSARFGSVIHSLSAYIPAMNAFALFLNSGCASSHTCLSVCPSLCVSVLTVNFLAHSNHISSFAVNKGYARPIETQLQSKKRREKWEINDKNYTKLQTSGTSLLQIHLHIIWVHMCVRSAFDRKAILYTVNQSWTPVSVIPTYLIRINNGIKNRHLIFIY